MKNLIKQDSILIGLAVINGLQTRKNPKIFFEIPEQTIFYQNNEWNQLRFDKEIFWAWFLMTYLFRVYTDCFVWSIFSTLSHNQGFFR